MAKEMGLHALGRLYAGLRQGVLDGCSDSSNAANWAKWSALSQEQVLMHRNRPCMLQVGQHGITNVLRQRQPRFASAFADDTNQALGPIEVRDLQVHNVLGPQPQPGQKQEHGAISKTVTGAYIDRSQDRLDSAGRQVPRNLR